MSDPLAPDRLVTVDEASTMVGVSRRTMYNWIQAGKVTTVQLASGRHRIVASSLMDQVAPSRVGYQDVCHVANRLRAVLARKDRLIPADVGVVLQDVLTLFESLTK